MQTKVVFVFIAVISIYKQACLSQDAIKGLGFSTALASADVRSGTAYCKGLYDVSGACVENSDIEIALTNAKWGMVQYMDLSWYTINAFADFKTDNQLVQMGIDLMKTAIASSGISESQMNQCKRNMQLLKFGSLCYLSSGEASEKSTVTGTNIEFEVLQTVAEQKEVCAEFFTNLCKLQTQFSMLDEQDQTANQFCTDINNIPQCNESDCTARYQKMNEVINTAEVPYSTEQMYNSTMDAVKQQIDLVKQQLESATTSETASGLMRGLGRRLQTQATFKYQMKVSASGTDTFSQGENSGQEATSSLHLLKVFVSFMTLLFL